MSLFCGPPRPSRSHILLKGDDDVERITELMVEIGERVQAEGDQERLGSVKSTY